MCQCYVFDVHILKSTQKWCGGAFLWSPLILVVIQLLVSRDERHNRLGFVFRYWLCYWLIDQFLKVFFVIIASSCILSTLHGTSAKPARGATMHTSQQSSEVVAAAAVADSDAPEVGAAGSSSAMPVLVFVLAAVAVTSVVDPRL